MTIYDGVAGCALRYAHALAQHDTRDMNTVEAVLAARVTLARCLIGAGWTPAAEVAAALELDTTVLKLTCGYGQENSPADDQGPVVSASTRTISLTSIVLPTQR